VADPSQSEVYLLSGRGDMVVIAGIERQCQWRTLGIRPSPGSEITRNRQLVAR